MKIKKLLLCVCFLLGISNAYAELTIVITEGSNKAQPIAVVPFANKGGIAVPFDIAKIIADDLQRSGDFDTLPVNRMLSLPENMEQVFFRDWRLLGQNYVLVGQISFDAGTNNYQITYELVDVPNQKRIVGEVVSANSMGLRRLAHRISDTVYERILGIKGAFSTKIAFITLQQVSKTVQEYRLQVADADGQNSFTLFKSPGIIMSPAWSNDGQHLVYVSYHSGRPAIYIQHVSSGHQRKVTGFPGINGAPMWSPDDSSLVMTLSKDGNPEIYRYNLATSVIDRLTNHYGIDTEASWSPDGKDLVFTSDRSGNPQVYRMSLKDRTPKRLTFIGQYNARPRFSLDGKIIYYVHQVKGDFHIASINMATGEQLILTSTPLDESPSLSPNGRMIMYATRSNNRGVLGVVSIDGGAKYILPSEHGDVREPAWSPFIK